MPDIFDWTDSDEFVHRLCRELKSLITGNAFLFMPDVAECALCHHELGDGSEYPRGPKGNQLSCEAKIIAVATGQKYFNFFYTALKKILQVSDNQY